MSWPHTHYSVPSFERSGAYKCVCLMGQRACIMIAMMCYCTFIGVVIRAISLRLTMLYYETPATCQIHETTNPTLSMNLQSKDTKIVIPIRQPSVYYIEISFLTCIFKLKAGEKRKQKNHRVLFSCP